MSTEVAMTLEEWRESMKRSKGCPLCGCKLIELDDECQQVMCPRCNVERAGKRLTSGRRLVVRNYESLLISASGR